MSPARGPLLATPSTAWLRTRVAASSFTVVAAVLVWSATMSVWVAALAGVLAALLLGSIHSSRPVSATQENRRVVGQDAAPVVAWATVSAVALGALADLSAGAALGVVWVGLRMVPSATHSLRKEWNSSWGTSTTPATRIEGTPASAHQSHTLVAAAVPPMTNEDLCSAWRHPSSCLRHAHTLAAHGAVIAERRPPRDEIGSRADTSSTARLAGAGGSESLRCAHHRVGGEPQ